MSYEDFIRRHSFVIKYKLSYEEYNRLLNYINSVVFNVINFNAYNININKCNEFVMFYLLQTYSAEEILNGDYDLIIENAVSSFAQKYYNAKNNSRKNCINYISSLLYELKSIFNNIDELNSLSYDIYNLLKFDNCSDIDILNKKYDNRIVDYIRVNEKLGKVSFNNEFNELRIKIYKITKKIFENNREQKNIFRDDYNIFNDSNCLNEIAFRAAIALYSIGNRVNSINYDSLNNFIKRDIDRLMCEKSSIIPKDRKKVALKEVNYHPTYQREKNAELKRMANKKKIIIGILVAIFILDNLTYKLFKNYKEERPKNNNKAGYEQTISNEEKNVIDKILESYGNKDREDLDEFSR